jgi:predicted peptidase
MGGYGTWEMGMSYPGFFAALAPICGGGVSWRVGLIGKTPVWAFHGDCDTVVPPVNSIEMCERLKAGGGEVKLTLFHGVDHNSWEPAYEETKVIEFLLNAKR